MNLVKWIVISLSTLLISAFITGCGGEPEKDSPANSVKGTTGGSYFIINTALTFEEEPAISGLTFKATTAGGVAAISGVAVEKNARALAAAVNGYVTLGELHAVIALISKENYIDGNISTINEQIFTKDPKLTKDIEFTVGDYSFSTDTNVTTVSLSNQIANTIAGTNENLSDANVSAYITASSFRMFVTVTSFNSEYYYTVSVSPDDNATFNENFALMTALSSGTNYTGVNERLVSNIKNFTGVGRTSNTADFLFMIDDSGSMSDQQNALTAAANDFDAALLLAGMNYNIAILTTSDGAQGSGCSSNCYDRVVKDIGIIDNNITLFKAQIDDINTSGSPNETGIYNSEQALKPGGLLNTAPLSFPRTNTQLSIVILSDEVSQYSSRAGTSFDPSDNIFVSNNILVNTIVDVGLCTNSFYGPGVDTNGQYDDLAIATGGLVGNICNGEPNPNFSAVMQNIVFQASGVYKLKDNFVKPNSLKVSVNGVFSAPSIKNGYMYIEGTNSIAFFGILPADGAKIEVYYEFPEDKHLFAK